MAEEYDIRPNEIAVSFPEKMDAEIIFIGRIHTPWTDRKDCPRQGRLAGPVCRIEIFEPWTPALQGIEDFKQLEVLYWLDRSRRDLVVQNPAHDDKLRGTFALRSPVRPNPIGTSIVTFEGREGSTVLVRGLDCLNGTPLVDLKPDRCLYSPLATPPKDDAETGG